MCQIIFPLSIASHGSRDEVRSFDENGVHPQHGLLIQNLRDFALCREENKENKQDPRLSRKITEGPVAARRVLELC